MGSVQRLDVVVAGNVTDVTRAFRSLGSETSKFQAGFGKFGSNVERASKKYAKGISKNLLSGIGDLAQSFLPAAGNVGVFAGALSSIPFGGAILGAAGLATALLTLRDNESQAAHTARELANAQKMVKDTVVAETANRKQQQATLVQQLEAQNRFEDATKSLTAARRALAAAEKKHGEDSRQARDARIALTKAEIDASAAARSRIETSKRAVADSQREAAGIDATITSLQKRRDALKGVVGVEKLLGDNTETALHHRSQLATVEDQLAHKTDAAAAAHRKAARTAADMAAAARAGGPPLANLAVQLSDISKQEIEKAQKIKALQAIGQAAADATTRIEDARAALQNLNAASVSTSTGGRTGGGQRHGGAAANSITSSSGIVAANRPGLSPADRVQASLNSANRDDSLQDKQARQQGEQAAIQAGVTDPDQIRARGEAAVLKRRITENQQRLAIVQQGLSQVRGQIAKALKARDAIFAKLRKTPVKDKKARQELQDRLRDVKQRLRDLYSDERGLMDEAADIRADAAELGFDLGQAESESAGTAVTGGSEGPSDADVAVALAATTPGTDDDLAARTAQLKEAESALATAIASGDKQAIIDAANKVTSIKDVISGFAGNGATTSTPPDTGSQSGAVKEITLNVYPTGAAAQDPRALAAALSWQFRSAVA